MKRSLELQVPEKYLLSPRKDRRPELLSQYYQSHHESRNLEVAKDSEQKLSFFLEKIVAWKKQFHQEDTVGVDLGCRGGVLTEKLLTQADWIGVDIDSNAVMLARQRGIPCCQLDISVNIDLTSSAFDLVMMTEVLEHLPYPAITVKEIHRLMKKGRKSGLFLGSVPIDYNLHQRMRVLRGERLESDPTHLHSFSFQELDTLLKHYFNHVEYLPLHGTASRHPWLPYHHFVRDLAWVASYPVQTPKAWKIRIVR